MRTISVALAALVAIATPTLASADALLTASDRVPLRAEPGVLVHPSLGFRVRDVGLVHDGTTATGMSELLSQRGAAATMHGWAYARGEDLVRIVLAASDTPRALSRELITLTADRFVSFGATLEARADEHGSSTAGLRFGPRTVVLRALPFHDGARGLVLMVTAIHSDGALARTIADSLEVPAPVSATPVASGLAREAIRATIRARLGDVRQCYESVLAARPELAGRVTVSFIIAANGSVQTAAISATTMHDDEVERCLLDVVQSFRFPVPAGGGVVGVNYPFVFDTHE